MSAYSIGVFGNILYRRGNKSVVCVFINTTCQKDHALTRNKCPLKNRVKHTMLINKF